jgi:acetyltransferase-like isoleucine patch superfamily enzyme
MHERSQNIITDSERRKHIEYDWYSKPLPENILLDPKSYPDTSYSFIRFQSESKNSFILGYGSGNYGHSNFIGGKKARIKVGDFVVLQGTTLICNESIIIQDHCMFSWGSIITDSWIMNEFLSVDVRRKLLIHLSESGNRHLEFEVPKPVVIEANVWVGFKAVILPGVTLGRGCVVGSNSIVSENVPPYAVVVGNPARILKYLSPDDDDNLKREALQKYTID